jgi:hypothetical protein
MTAIFISYRRISAPKDARMLFERLISEFGRDFVFLGLPGILDLVRDTLLYQDEARHGRDDSGVEVDLA